MVHNLLMYAVFHFGQLKNLIFFQSYFFGAVITWHDHPRYAKHVLGSICVFFTLFRYCAGVGGVLPRDWYRTCLCSFSPSAAQKSQFPKHIFLILRSPKLTIQGM